MIFFVKKWSQWGVTCVCAGVLMYCDVLKSTMLLANLQPNFIKIRQEMRSIPFFKKYFTCNDGRQIVFWNVLVLALTGGDVIKEGCDAKLTGIAMGAVGFWNYIYPRPIKTYLNLCTRAGWALIDIWTIFYKII